jgi:hypothetical protein
MPCVRVFLVVLVVVFGSACGSGDGPTEPSPPANSGGSGSPNPPPPPAPNTTITVSAAGVSPQVLTVAVGTRVTFTNNDSRPHDFSGGPDPSQPECAEIDAAGFVAAGQSRQTAAFTTARTCRYHDHAYLGVPAFTGQIVIQ